MNYRALIENRRSVREFLDKAVSPAELAMIKTYYYEQCRRLDPKLRTALLVFDHEAGKALEGAAGYHQFLIGAPAYLVLLSEQGPQARENAGYMMEDMVLKLSQMGLGSCWLTFTDSEAVKNALGIESKLDAAAILAFGYGKPAARRPRINILSMSNIDISAKRHYMDPKRGVADMAFLNTWGNRHGVDDYIGFFDDMLWEALYAASLAPSYLNRQAYGFLLEEGRIWLVQRPDEYTTDHDGALSLGIVLLHFDAVAETWSGKRTWDFAFSQAPVLPEGHRAVAVSHL